jgi:hypothetical protein
MFCISVRKFVVGMVILVCVGYPSLLGLQGMSQPPKTLGLVKITFLFGVNKYLSNIKLGNSKGIYDIV